nr:AAA family ATPase [Trueperaceae bacterium]
MPLLERAPLLASLTASMDEALRGRGRLVLLGGEAGVGKSSLLHTFARGLPPTVDVLVGLCDPVSTPKPLGPLLDVAAALGIEVADAAYTTARHDVFRGVLAALGRRPGGTLLVFEDVHWADGATLDLLRYLGRRIDGIRALLVASYRDEEVGARHPLRIVVGDLATSASVSRLAVPPLSPEAVRTLAEGHSVDTAALHRRTGGNPFFVSEILASDDGGALPGARCGARA